MANKLGTKLGGMLSNLFAGSEKKSETDIIDDARERDVQLRTALKILMDKIQFDKTIKLDPQIIKENKIENRIARMLLALEDPLITTVDTASLDKQVLDFVNSLDLAVTQGHKHAAYWSSMALFKTVEVLRVVTPALYEKDSDMQKALYENKVHYAQNFNNIITLAIEQDRLETAKQDLETDFNANAARMRELEENYKQFLSTDFGKNLFAGAQAKLAAPATMTDDEKYVMDLQKEIARLQDQLSNSTVTWEGLDSSLTATIQNIEQIRLQLLQDPDVKDEKLAAKIQKSSEIFREELKKRLDDAYLLMAAGDEHTAKMQELLKHPAIKAKYAKMAQAIADMENNWLKEALNRQAAQRTIAHQAESLASIMESVKQLEQEILAETQPEVQTHQNVQTHTEIEMA